MFCDLKFKVKVTGRLKVIRKKIKLIKSCRALAHVGASTQARVLVNLFRPKVKIQGQQRGQSINDVQYPFIVPYSTQ